MRLPNRYGSVFKMGGKRRRPWRVMKDGKTIAYTETRAEGLKILSNYQPVREETFEDVYKAWEGTRDNVANYYKQAYLRCAPLHKMRMADIRVDDLMKVMKSQELKSAPEKIQVLLSQLYKYAMRHEIIDKNYAQLMDSIPKAEPKKKMAFTEEEINQLWKDDSDISRMILVHIYTGWRPAELVGIKIDGDLMTGGMKTEAGKDRIVPIHPKIKDIIKEYDISYPKYYYQFGKKMKQLGMQHSPHDCRVTFASLCAEYNVNEHVRKLLMGHSESDLTERVYTRRTIDQLREEIKKIG